MKFTPNKNFAENHLKTFIEKNILDYTKLRNFDYGPETVSYTHLTLPTNREV